MLFNHNFKRATHRKKHIEETLLSLFFGSWKTTQKTIEGATVIHSPLVDVPCKEH
jgi:hypothetical protein|tara:strand:+ start:225 stop:389 length:165 start_codon:yes stop_codon:yes gene_type:complete